MIGEQARMTAALIYVKIHLHQENCRNWINHWRKSPKDTVASSTVINHLDTRQFIVKHISQSLLDSLVLVCKSTVEVLSVPVTKNEFLFFSGF